MAEEPIAFRDIPQYPKAYYRVDIPWDYLEDWIESHPDIDLDPDFQRAHVWTEEQQSAFVEWMLRGGESGYELVFNHPGANHGWRGKGVLVDGKQRLEAVRKFLRGELKVMGRYRDDYIGRTGHELRFSMRFGTLKTRAEILEWYLLFNSGGTDHTREELSKVEAMLEAETLG